MYNSRRNTFNHPIPAVNLVLKCVMKTFNSIKKCRPLKKSQIFMRKYGDPTSQTTAAHDDYLVVVHCHI